MDTNQRMQLTVISPDEKSVGKELGYCNRQPRTGIDPIVLKEDSRKTELKH
jgi:hypothetical protein